MSLSVDDLNYMGVSQIHLLHQSLLMRTPPDLFTNWLPQPMFALRKGQAYYSNGDLFSPLKDQHQYLHYDMKELTE